MTSINITYGNNDVKEQFDIPVMSLIEMKVKSIEVIKGLVLNTDSNIWLKEAEDKWQM
jgi:hypothetical protein